jgi:hypothetical protein
MCRSYCVIFRELVVSTYQVTAFKYLSSLASTDSDLPEDDAVVSKHEGAVQ